MAAAPLRAATPEPEAEIDETNLGISLMLLGGITFFMAMFYLVNHPDTDMQRYSWKVISSTISIFSSVLLFQAVEGSVKAYFADVDELLLDALHMLFWLLAMQLVLAVIAGAVKPLKSTEGLQMNMESFARLMGHITGFSAIQAWGTVQQLLVHGYSQGLPVLERVLALASVPLVCCGMYCLVRSTDVLREKIATFDQEISAREAIWDEKTRETENDVFGLTLSFLLVQVLRFYIGGHFPNQDGEEPRNTLHSGVQVLCLLGSGTLFAVLGAWVKQSVARSLHRLDSIWRITWAMCFAWCTFYGFSWWLTSSVLVEEHDAIVGVVLALINTGIAFSSIRFLDFLADLEATDESVDMSIFAVIEALGICVGFSWEQAFDVAVGSVAEQVVSLPPSATKLCLALLLCALVVPAWRFYILPTEMLLLEEHMQNTGESASRQLSGSTVLSSNADAASEESRERKKRRQLMRHKAHEARHKLVVCSKLRALQQQSREAENRVHLLQTMVSQKRAELRTLVKQRSSMNRWSTMGSLAEHLLEPEEEGRLAAIPSTWPGYPDQPKLPQTVSESPKSFLSSSPKQRALVPPTSESPKALQSCEPTSNSQPQKLQHLLALREQELDQLRANCASLQERLAAAEVEAKRAGELGNTVQRLEEDAREHEQSLAQAQAQAKAYAAELARAVRFAEHFAQLHTACSPSRNQSRGVGCAC